MLEEIERKIKQRIDQQSMFLSGGRASTLEAYKYSAGEIAGCRYALDIIKDVMREHEKL